MQHIKLTDYFYMGAPKFGNTLFPFVENAIACRIRCRKLRKEEFLDTLRVVQVGRGMDVKVVIDDLPKFEALEAEIKMLETRASDIDKMLIVLEGIVSKAEDIELPSPSPDGLRSGAGQRRNEIADIRRWLAKHASTYLGVDTFAEPLCTPDNLNEFMKKDLDEANEKIAQMEKEIEILDGLYKESFHVMAQNAHLLEPAEEPEPEPKPRLYFGDVPQFLTSEQYEQWQKNQEMQTE